MYYSRLLENEVSVSLKSNPVTAILGSRQSGKSTLAKKILESHPDAIYLDLERPSDLEKLKDAEWFFQSNSKMLFCIDEIQRKPDLFPLIRSLTDEWGRNGAFLILGSASRDLIQHSAETLAGRIRYLHLSPFIYSEVQNYFSMNEYLVRGGFPRSLLAGDLNESFRWREDFITGYLERDLLLWSGFSPVTMRRLWKMLAHLNGQTVNYSLIGNSLGVSHNTIRNYIELLSETFMLKIVPPFFTNTKKRLVKAPKIYLPDQGLLNALLDIRDFNQLSGHPVMGTLWESVVLSNLQSLIPSGEFYFYRTSNGAELDFIIAIGNKSAAVECKATLSPVISKGTYIALADTGISKLFVIAPIEKGWRKSENTYIVSLGEAIPLIRNELGI
jgi:predicted AAA+ superfamily ATPase